MLFTPFTFKTAKPLKTVSSNPPWKSNLPKTTSRLKNLSAFTTLGQKAVRAF